jgi:hypothetical protein
MIIGTYIFIILGFAIRLSGGQDNWGRVEVRHNGIWGQLCNDRWTDASANVTCKELGKGFIGGVAFGPIATPNLPFWLVDTTCSGKESSIQKCNYTQWGEPLLFGCNAASVLCYKTTGKLHYSHTSEMCHIYSFSN